MLCPFLTSILACDHADRPRETDVPSESASNPQESGAPETESETEPETESETETETESETEPTPLPASCEAPASLPTDPLTELGRIQYTLGDAFFMELVDVWWDGGPTVWAVGQGGLLGFDVTDPSAPTLTTHLLDPRNQRFHRVQPVASPDVAISERDKRVLIVDPTVDPPFVRSELTIDGVEGLAWSAPHLVVSVREEGVRVYDLTDPDRPRQVGAAAGLSAPWDLSPIVDGWTYAADAALGVVPIDVRDPTAPVIGAAVTLSGVQHVDADATRIVAARGTTGVSVLDRVDPSAPTLRATLATGGSATSVALDGDSLFVADHEGVALIDVTDLDAPVSVGRQATDEFALAVDAAGGRAWVGDWTLLIGMASDPDALAGDLDLGLDAWVVPLGETSARFSFRNRGAGPLTLHGATGATLFAEPWVLPSGGVGSFTVEVPDGGATLDTTVCIASDDPDRPTLEIPLRRGVSEPPLGELAPEFNLEELNTGATRTLSEHLGDPVLIALFAYW